MFKNNILYIEVQLEGKYGNMDNASFILLSHFQERHFCQVYLLKAVWLVSYGSKIIIPPNNTISIYEKWAMSTEGDNALKWCKYCVTLFWDDVGIIREH